MTARARCVVPECPWDRWRSFPTRQLALDALHAHGFLFHGASAVRSGEQVAA